MLRRACFVLLAALLAACGASEAAAPPAPTGTVGGVGSLPEALTGVTNPAVTATSTTVPRSTVVPSTDDRQIGERVDGNRLIVIGDSLMASTSRRYGGEMCTALVPLGWAVEVNAETSRAIDFGVRVLERRLRPQQGVDWDAAVIMLGNNYGGNLDGYTALLHDILDLLAPRPTVLLTVTEIRPNRVQLNETLRSMPSFHPNVTVLDWATISVEHPEFLSGDGLHLSDAGRGGIVFEIARLLGGSPMEPDGECLSTSFTDDSAGKGVGVPSPGSGSGTGSGSGRSTTTTVGGAASTTLPAAATTAASTLPTTTGAVPSTLPATTLPSATTSPTTPAPPTTGAPPPTSTPHTTPPDDDPEGG